MSEYPVRMSAHIDDDHIVIKVQLDDATLVMRYRNMMRCIEPSTQPPRSVPLVPQVL